MSIKTRLKISASILVVIAMTIVATLVVMARQIEEATREGFVADRIVKAAGEINLLARMVAHQHEDNKELQWWDRHTSLTRLIDEASMQGEKQKLLLARLANTNMNLALIFYRVRMYREAADHASGERKELYAESEERLAAQLLAKTEQMVYDAGLLVQESNRLVLTVQTRAFQIVLSLVVMLIGNVLLTFYHLYGTIVQSLEKLHGGARAIAKGDFDQRVVMGAPSEIAGLATAFNAMGERLKTSYRSLQASERRYKDLTEFLPQTVFETDRSGKLTFVNGEALRAFDREREEVTGKIEFLELMSEKDRGAVKRAMDGSVEEERTTRADCMALTRDGRLFPACAYFSPIIENGEVMGLRGILIDMTEQKKVERQLQQAQKMEAIGTLSGGIAHDFNNILAAIIGFTELALDDTRGRPETRFLENVLRASTRGKELVRQILTFSRRQDQPRRPTVIGPVVEETMKLLRASIPSTIEIRSAIPAETLTINSEPTQIQQVLMNLSMNAAHAMRERGGVLEISLSRALFGQADLPRSTMEAGEYVVISVRDNGTGMSQATTERIFDPFFTTKGTGEGTGLGLSVVHGIVENHGGVIEVESELGKGSVFHIMLPLVGQQPEAQFARGEESIGQGRGRILLVDDEPDIVEVEKVMLERLGYSVVAKASSAEALKAFDADSGGFDAIITDQTMPEITGIVLARKIIEKRSDVPVILCTGYSEAVSESEARKVGIRELVMKPITKREMWEVLRRVLEPASTQVVPERSKVG